MYVRVWKFLEEYSLLLVLGALIALFWANLSYEDYHHVGHMVLLSNSYVGQVIDGQRVLTLHYLINDVLMAFFFAIAGKEIWEGIVLKNGSLKGTKALTPLVATLGGIIGPVVVYLLIATFLGSLDTLKNGWAIPTATDIAFSYLVGRIIFGAGHPAVAFLLLLAVADDALGLTILALFYPQGEIKLEWLAFSFLMSLTAYLVLNRKFKVNSFWPYLAFGALGWYGFQEAGIHPALGLLPIIPAMPHAETDLGFFSGKEIHRQDALNKFEHQLKPFVEVVLFFFGLFNAGVLLSAVGDATYAVTFALLIGKPLGIFLFALLAVRILGLQLPKGMTIKDTLVVGQIAGIGFTVALFVTGVALPAGPVQDAAKMGALFSFGSAILSFALARFLGVKKVNGELSQLKTRLRPGFFFLKILEILFYYYILYSNLFFNYFKMNSRISFDLSGTTTVVTGGSSGIGLATAQLISKSGGNVVVTSSRSEEKTKKALDLIKSSGSGNNTVLSFPYDAANQESVKDFFDEVKKVSKRVDYLVHAIGISPDTPFDEQDADLWNHVLSTNVTGTFLALKNAKNIMSNQDIIDEVRGKIVLITSTNGVDSYGIFSAPYDASKAAMINMVRNIGEDFHKNHQIHINGIGPGWIATDMNKSVPEDEMRKELEKVWSARMAKPEEIAQNILALLTLPYNSGRDHMIDGGYR